MRISRLASLVGASLLVTGCAGLLPTQQGTSTSTQIGAQGASASAARSSDVVGVLSEVQELRLEMRQLRDRIERQEFELERLQGRQRDLYDDLDQRLRAQERGRASGAAPLAPAGLQSGQSPELSMSGVPMIGAPADGARAPQVPVTGGQSGIVMGSPGITTPPVGSDPATISGAGTGQVMPTSPTPGQVAIVQPEISGGPVSGSAQEAYDQAFSLLKQSRYSDAIQAFEAFNREYPANDLTDDAYYWLAEARYVTREFEAALNGFRTVTANFPNSQRVPASYLKIGYIQYEIGAYTDARDTLTNIMKNFPTHRVAVSAETRLRKMDREGR